MTHPLDTLWQTVLKRADADPEQSWTAKLLTLGMTRIAQKVGEEALETAIEAARLDANVSDKAKLAEESADLLYHLNVLWLAAGLTPHDVYAVLEKRRGLSGIAEKQAR